MVNNVIFGFGAMRLPQTDENNPKSVDYGEVEKMVDYYMDHGFNYFDTSFAYHDGVSEDMLKKALIERYPRESYRIADKIPTWLLKEYDDNQKFVDIMLNRLGIDYFDVLLIHNINEVFMDFVDNAKSFDYILEAKRKGIAKKIGFSFHGKAEQLEKLFEKYADIVDVVQIQLNYSDWNNKRIQSRKCYNLCEKYDVEVIVMEPLKGGTLVNLPESILNQFTHDSPAKMALRFAGSHKNVSIVLSGVNTLEDVVDNCETFKNFKKN